jgi:hypothetical protein
VSPVAGNATQEARNRELNNMVMTALCQGSGMHLLDASPDDDGHAAWQAIVAWHVSAAMSRFTIDHCPNKLESLQLNGSTEASAFVNVFFACWQKLEAKNEGHAAETKRQKSWTTTTMSASNC